MFSNFQERLMATVTGGRPEFLEDIPLEEKQNLSEEDIDLLLQLTVRLLKQNNQQIWRARRMLDCSETLMQSFSRGLIGNLARLCAFADPTIDYAFGAVDGETDTDPEAYREAVKERKNQIFEQLVKCRGVSDNRSMQGRKIIGSTQ